jgi:membrane protein DedA with SNARE-associated domain
MHGPFIGVLTALLVAGLGVPLPEDVSLVSAGYLVYLGLEPLWAVMLFCFVALVAGDSALYAIGRRFGPSITKHRFLRHRLTAARLERVERHFEKHGSKTVFLGRFVVGARALFFLTAGAMKMSYGRFIFWDGIGCVLSTIGWVLVGFLGGAQIHRVRGMVKSAQHVAILVVALVLVTWIVTRLLRRRVAGPPIEEPSTESRP